MELIQAIRELANESLLIQLVIIVTAVKLAGTVSDKLKQPTVFGKLLIGIIIGPSMLGLIRETETLVRLADLGVIVLMFLAGLETDVEEFKKAGYAATLTAAGGVILPMAAGTLYGLVSGYNLFISLFIGTVLTATSVSISAQTLRELGWLQTPAGMTILGAAVIDDVLGIVVLTLVLGLAGAGGGGVLGVAVIIGKMLLFFVFSVYLGKKLILPVLNWFSRTPVSQGLTATALVLAFLFAFVSEKAGVANITGSYIAGILIGMTGFKDEIIEKTEALGFSLLIPIFFAGIGLRANAKAVTGSITFIVIISLIAVLTKIIGCGAGARLSGFAWKYSLVIGTGMISRGEIALIVATIGLSRHLIQSPLYTVLVVTVLVSTVITPPLLKAVIQWSDPKMKAKA